MVDVDLIFVLEGVLPGHGKSLHEANEREGDGVDEDGGGGVEGEGGEPDWVPTFFDRTYHRDVMAWAGGRAGGKEGGRAGKCEGVKHEF